MSPQRDRVRVAPEHAAILPDPLDGQDLVPEAVVARVLLGHVGHEAEHAQAVVDDGDHDTAVRGQNRAVEQRRSAHHVAPAVDVHHHGHVREELLVAGRRRHRYVQVHDQTVLAHVGLFDQTEQAVRGDVDRLVADDGLLRRVHVARAVLAHACPLEPLGLLGVRHADQFVQVAGRVEALAVNSDESRLVQTARRVVHECACRQSRTYIKYEQQMAKNQREKGRVETLF